MISGRVAAAIAAAAALLAIVGIASRGRPLSGGGAGRGPSATFFDYVATSLVIVGVLVVVVLLFALLAGRRRGNVGRGGQWHLLSTLLTLAGAALLSWFIFQSGFVRRFGEADRAAQRQRQAQPPPRGQPEAKDVRNPELRWDEIVIVLVLLGGTAVALYATRRARHETRALPRLRRGGEAVSAALDESLDDLRSDPDLRRAIIAAYARMERALAAVGLARRPSEAPFEYVERALLSLEASADAAERLTSLFEWAKFSQHEPGPEMRDEAIDALVAVRDELRAPAVAA